MLTIFLYTYYFLKYRHAPTFSIFKSIIIKSSKINASHTFKFIFLKHLWRYFLFSLCYLKYRHIVTLIIFLPFLCLKNLVNSTSLDIWHFYFRMTILTKNIVTLFIFSSVSTWFVCLSYFCLFRNKYQTPQAIALH